MLSVKTNRSESRQTRREPYMIERITVAGHASYGKTPEELTGLKAINFVYGPNAAGKTTISQIISGARPNPTCAVRWERGTELETTVYNRDFVKANFNSGGDLKGIFTLGEKDIETQNKIRTAKEEIDRITRSIEQLTESLEGIDGLGGKVGERNTIEFKFRDTCWALKTKHDPKLQGAMAGFRDKKENFKEKLCTECKKTPTQILTLEELEKRASSVFGPAPSTEMLLSEFNEDAFLNWQNDDVLKKRVIGKTDVDIAAMILKLGNSDWVKQGIPYFEANNGDCPFCQQRAPDQLVESLAEYFDESFARDTSRITEIKNGYSLHGERIQSTLETAAASSSRFLDIEKLKIEKSLFDSRFQLNKQRIENKAKEPSQPVVLEPLEEVLTSAKQLLAEANEKIKEHNSMVLNLAKEKELLKARVWAYLANVEIKSAFESYKTEIEDVQKAINSISTKIVDSRKEKSEKEKEIHRLEKSTTSVQPTVAEINRILQAFGFSNFSLGATKTNQYKIIRQDGTDAKETLSEGEQSFLTFLYFFHLLKGSNSESGMMRDRVVVFDDPVSSLDSDVLFIVSNLIRQAIEEAHTGKGTIKQVFVLTHNVYFHKEVTFDKNRQAGAAFKDETFWTIRKVNGASKIQNHKTNPITTSYELLWSEVRDPDRSSKTIQNSLRRILEYYFRILGGISNDDILDRFQGEEKLLCRSLLSWSNDGSHAVQDDLYLTLDPDTVDKYLNVFRNIFVRLEHLNHYNMMMGSARVIQSAASER